ncbi:MAG: aldehyde dehydrogenase family protein, partial [Bacteroidia bacterium]
MMMDFLNLGKKQRAQRPFFIPVSERKQLLKKLKTGIQQFEHDILKALHQDLGKSEFEAYSSEIGFIYQNISHTLKHLDNWSEPQRVKTGLSLFPSKAHIHYQPFGTVLIIAPWNYPFQLCIAPLVASIAAGNRALLKPSELTPETSAVLSRLIQHIFDESEVAIVEGDGKTIVPKAIKEYRPNLIFFTGSTAVGREISKMAAEHLIPCILELGGKSPCIVDETADLDTAVKRIAFGKGINAGQTCVAPDYFLVHEEIETEFTEKLKTSFQAFYQNALDNEEYTKIVNEHHFQRIQHLLKDTQVVFGGKSDEHKKRIEPTLVKCDVDSPIMNEEIFGPISPIFTYKTIEDIHEYINKNPNPLSLYLFANNRK